MGKYKYILFDLDGTLTDSGEGITKSAQYALKHFGIDEQNLEKLEYFVGPPLGESFEKCYGFSEEQSREAIAVFRERYNDIGVFENKLYPGMVELLKDCKAEGVKLGIASSKPMFLVEKVLKHFEIEQYFDVKVGSLLDGTRQTKEDVMNEVMRQFFGKGKIPKEEILMVGDRKFDVEAAKKFGFDSLAVAYGYAPEGELKKCNPTYLADSIMEMRKVMLGHFVSYETAQIPALRKSIFVLKPLFLYWLVTVLVVTFGAVLVGMFSTNSADVARQIQDSSSQIAVYISALAALFTYPIMYYYYTHSYVEPMSHISKARIKRRFLKWSAIIIVTSCALAVGLNLLFTKIAFLENSKSYQQTASLQYSIPTLAGVILFGVIVPIAEELTFRGVLYNRIKLYFGPVIAIILSALIFGVYHGNIVQFFYATIMGIAMAFVYEKFQTIWASILFHCSANIIVYLLTKLAV